MARADLFPSYDQWWWAACYPAYTSGKNRNAGNVRDCQGSCCMLEGRMRCDDFDDCNECMHVSKQSAPALAVFYPAATCQWFAVL